MTTRRWFVRGFLAAALAALVLPGCGGGSSSAGGGSGSITGRLASSAAGGTVRLDGTTISALVGSDGSFSLPSVPPGQYTLTVTAAGGLGGSTMVQVLGGQATSVTNVTVAAVGQIAGLVTSAATSQPVAGARVVALLTPMLWAYAGSSPPAVVNGVEAAGGSASRQTTTSSSTTGSSDPPLVATTDSNGSYTITGVPPGPYSIEVSADGYQSGYSGTYVNSDDTATGDVQLTPIDPNNATLTGNVQGVTSGVTAALAEVRVDLWPQEVAVPVASGASVPSTSNSSGSTSDVALISGEPVIGTNIDPWQVPPFAQGQTVMTDEQGNYTIRNIAPGTYTLSFTRYGYTPVSLSVTLSSQQSLTENTTLTNALATVSGTVYASGSDGSTAPLAGAWVDAYGSVVMPLGVGGATGGSGTSRSRGKRTALLLTDTTPPPGVAVTASDGTYTLQVLAGDVTVSAYADNYQPASVELTVTQPGATGVNLTLTPWTNALGPVPAQGGFGLAVPVTSRRK